MAILFPLAGALSLFTKKAFPKSETNLSKPLISMESCVFKRIQFF